MSILSKFLSTLGNGERSRISKFGKSQFFGHKKVITITQLSLLKKFGLVDMCGFSRDKPKRVKIQ